MKPYTQSLGSDVLEEDSLRFSNDLVARNVPELIKVLSVMSDEEFLHHVSKSQNEVGAWILDFYGNGKLARKINKTKKKVKIIKLLEKALFEEEKMFAREKKRELRKILHPRSKRSILGELSKVDDHLGGNF